MMLHERMETNNQEQISYFVTLCHDEWLEQALADSLEPRDELFDEWLEYIGWAAVKMSVPRPRFSADSYSPKEVSNV